MNVIVSNQKKQMLSKLNIEIIKELDGEFSVDEIVDNFKNFFFQRMILDITALKDYTDIKTIQKLSVSLDMSKIILVLDENTNTVSPEFMSQLISIGIYNFTTNLDGIMYLYNSPNSYRDVAHLHIINQPSSSPVDMGSTSDLVSSGSDAKVVIGIKNLTKQSGATTLAYIMKKALQQYYSVACIEVEKNDFRFFDDKELISANNNGKQFNFIVDYLSANNNDIGSIVSKNRGKDVIIIDVNNSENAIGMCNKMIYLIEPSMIKLNRLMVINPRILDEIRNKKVVLNQSLLDSKDISEFEFESKLKIFCNIPPLDERKKNFPELTELFNKLGLSKIN